MQRSTARFLALLAFGAALHVASDAEARMPPDVMLLVDSSGSMAYTSIRDPNNPSRYALPRCAAWPSTTPVNFDIATITDSNGATAPDRWAMLVRVLNGTVRTMGCSAQSRSSTDFINEFKLGTTPPSDANYYLPFNRITALTASNTTCTTRPSASAITDLSTNAFSWPAGAIVWSPVGSTGYCGALSTMRDVEEPGVDDVQEPDGLIDAYSRSVRFGLMTFDTSPNWTNAGTIEAGTGLDGVAANFPSGIGGTWSYYPGYFSGWDGTTTSSYTTGPRTGNFADCSASNGLLTELFEVGARNPGAPPWEGRLIGFGDPMDEDDAIHQHNAHVQAAIGAVRPFGGTPIAGMLQDAVDFMLHDQTTISANGHGLYWGGAVDKAISTDPTSDACRKRYIILLTDGGPNLDMRPECALTGTTRAGKCPYEKTPVELAQDLSDNNIPVYVIGFAVTTPSNNSTATCTQLLHDHPNACDSTNSAGMKSCTQQKCTSGDCVYGYCVDSSQADSELMATCCTLKSIADAGHGQAYFAENAAGLSTAFAQIMQDIIQPPIAPSQPVFASVSAHNTGTASSSFQGAQFLSGTHQATTGTKTIVGDLGVGDLDRQRIKCEPDSTGTSLVANDKEIEIDMGDKYQVNVDAFKTTRTVYTVLGEVDSATSRIWSSRSIRPRYDRSSSDDKFPSYGISSADHTSNLVSYSAQNFPLNIPATAVVDPTTTQCQAGRCCFGFPSTAAKCTEWYLKLELGARVADAADPTDPNDPFAKISYVRNSAFGSVERTPVLISQPSAYLRDDSYTRFQRLFGTKRPPVLFVTTADGQLHAFDTSKTDNSELSELWTFIPPAMLPAITEQFQSRFTATAKHFMNGVLVTRDVPGVADTTTARFLSRTAEQAAGTVATNWYTILVGSYGDRTGYFAMDVTWPDPETDLPTGATGYVKGPRFLWQLTTDNEDRPLFGTNGSRPAIAVLYFKMPGDDVAKEHAVAILPGGQGGTLAPDLDDAQFMQKSDYSNVLDSKFGVRDKTRHYDGGLELAGARSVTIVRLDTGEIIRTFRYGVPGATLATNQAPPGLYSATPTRITNAGFDAPIGGEIVAYPANAGTVADRAYVGDAQGRLWRLNLASPDPAAWDTSMILDAYPTSSDPDGAAYSNDDVGPIETPPIVSTDPLGRVTVAVSTGGQTVLSTSGKFPVWSMTEYHPSSGTLPATHVNWFLNENNASKSGDATEYHFGGGERVMGPMSLFSGILYFTSQVPPPDNLVQCSSGEAFLWAVHYINAGTTVGIPSTTPDPSDGPMPEHPDVDLCDSTEDTAVPNPLDPNLVRFVSLCPGSVAYGIGIRQRPSCYDTSTVSTDSDPFLGYGTHSAISTATPGNFQLVVQTGNAGKAAAGTNVRTITETVAPPAGGVTIDSWAAILE